VQEIPIYRFGGFSLDASNRELRDGEHRLDLNTRYFDALVLLVREQGRLVHKERFFEEVWNDVVVSDSALTQCVKEIRRQLGDDVANPRFIETVPRHGYRFIAEVSTAVPATDAERSTRAIPTPDLTPTPPLAGRGDSGLSAALATTLAGTLGGAVAGLLGGFLYGSGLAYSPVDQEIGTASVLLVMISLTAVLGTVGGFGIGAGVAAADFASGGRPGWRIPGAVLGGMLIGGSVKLLGVDAFNLLFGRTPAGITGGMEGAALGLAVGLGALLGGGIETPASWRPIAAAAATGAVMGVLIALAGGHLMGGSLDLLARSFSDSRLQLEAIGRYFGDVRFGPTTRVILAGIEGCIFVGCVAAALVVAGRAGHSGPAKRL